MGAMKTYLTEIGETLYRQDHSALRMEFNDADKESKIWLISQMCALRTGYNGETGMFTLDHEPELWDGFFIGGRVSTMSVTGFALTVLQNTAVHSH